MYILLKQLSQKPDLIANFFLVCMFLPPNLVDTGFKKFFFYKVIWDV